MWIFPEKCCNPCEYKNTPGKSNMHGRVLHIVLCILWCCLCNKQYLIQERYSIWVYEHTTRTFCNFYCARLRYNEGEPFLVWSYCYYNKTLKQELRNYAIHIPVVVSVPVLITSCTSYIIHRITALRVTRYAPLSYIDLQWWLIYACTGWVRDASRSLFCIRRVPLNTHYIVNVHTLLQVTYLVACTIYQERCIRICTTFLNKVHIPYRIMTKITTSVVYVFLVLTYRVESLPSRNYIRCKRSIIHARFNVHSCFPFFLWA